MGRKLENRGDGRAAWTSNNLVEFGTMVSQNQNEAEIATMINQGQPVFGSVSDSDNNEPIGPTCCDGYCKYAGFPTYAFNGCLGIPIPGMENDKLYIYYNGTCAAITTPTTRTTPKPGQYH